MAEEEKWDIEIKPRTGLFEINFSEIWKYRDLIILFVKRDFVAQYTQTVLGPIWHFIQPILTTIMFLLVFGKIANIPTDGINPILFFMSGITMWNYFSQCLTNTSNTFILNAPIFGKVYFPRIIVPISIVLSNMIRLGIQFSLLLVTMIWLWLSGGDIHVTLINWLWIPVLVLMMAGLSLGMGIVVSSLTTKYRDLNVLLGFAVQLYMYATPIAYPMSYLKDSKIAWLIRINPLTPIVEAFRYCLFGNATLTINDLLYSLLFLIVLLAGGFLLFNRVEKQFMDTV